MAVEDQKHQPHGAPMGNYMTYVLRMPASGQTQAEITKAISDLVSDRGGEVVGMTLEKEILLNDALKSRLGAEDAEEVCRKVAAKVEGCK